jgi:alkylated DNA repair dioxygenase AlkB
MLFAEPLIGGLDYRDDFITADEHDRCSATSRSRPRAVPLPGWTGNRKTQSFGWRYDFDDASFTPADPLPTGCSRCATRRGDGRRGADDFVHVLLARYDPGAGSAGTATGRYSRKVVGVSLNTPRSCAFAASAAASTASALDVAPRSAYLLSGEARHDWEHSIAPGEQLRFSITFRTLSDLAAQGRAARPSPR